VKRLIRLGISTCPNDTFLLHALLEGEIDLGELEFEVEFLDVQELNDRLIAGDFDAAKASFYCGLTLAGKLAILDCGSALGFGVGPLLLGSKERTNVPQRVLCPGRWTTANLLYSLFHADLGQPEQVVFSEIIPALEAGEADLGVCIHEGRFTWQARGLDLVSDLGVTWESATDSPLPLGGIFIRKSLGADVASQVNACLRASLDWGLAHREATLKTMSRHAQELDPAVIWSHVDLYVNEHTHTLGSVGQRALTALDREARRAGLLAVDAPRLEIFS